MKMALANFVSSGGTMLAVAGGAAVVALGASELERRRRSHLYARGKMGDANLLEYREHMVVYSYAIGGVEYMASQDLSDLLPQLPEDRWSAIGPASIKYDPRNPANSIVLSEEWSGLRPSHRVE
jgi:hypothetical protein